MEVQRVIPIQQTLQQKSILLLGPRRTGKSFLLQHQLKLDNIINLLESETYRSLLSRPELLREMIQPHHKFIAIDEIQRIPELLNEVHLLIETRQIHFILTGSSARKLARTHTSFMAGRARRMTFLPLVSCEIPDFQLEKILTFGALPPVYLSTNPYEELRDYSMLYLREEIINEALIRKIDNFSRFLDFAALSNAQILNFEAIARNAQVPARTIREYFTVLEDTMMGTMLMPLPTTGERKSSSKGKFYFFDIGVLNSLLKRKTLVDRSREFGDLFETFIFLELKAYREYIDPDLELHFWRMNENHEVDFVINQEIAIEVKATKNVHPNDLKGLNFFSATGHCKRKIIVSQDKVLRHIGDIEIYPYRLFLEKLWRGDLLTTP